MGGIFDNLKSYKIILVNILNKLNGSNQQETDKSTWHYAIKMYGYHVNVIISSYLHLYIYNSSSYYIIRSWFYMLQLTVI